MIEDVQSLVPCTKASFAAFRHEFVAPSGRLVSEAVTSYSLAIMFDILDPEQKARAGDRLAEMVEEAGIPDLHRVRRNAPCNRRADRHRPPEGGIQATPPDRIPSFLYPVTMGATTMWERWDSVLPDGRVNATGMTSLNHYALGAVADWLHRVVGGLQASSRVGSDPRRAPAGRSIDVSESCPRHTRRPRRGGLACERC